MHTFVYLYRQVIRESLLSNFTDPLNLSYLILLRAYSITQGYNNSYKKYKYKKKHTEVIPSENYLNKMTMNTLFIVYFLEYAFFIFRDEKDFMNNHVFSLRG